MMEAVMAEAVSQGRDETAGAGARTLVVGMGSTGASVARYLAARGETADFVDTRELPPGLHGILAVLPGAAFQLGSRDAQLARSIERIVVSPGVPLDLPLLRDAQTRGLEVVSDIDLFVTECHAPVIAVTGSNGKSTVTAMVAALLRAAGWHAPAGGNLGTPALDLLDADADAYVLELSSFQLERSRPVPAAASVLLNLSPDHLDTHGGLEAYAAAKRKIYAACRHAVVNRDEPALAASVPAGVATTSFGLGEPGPDDFGLRQVRGVEHLCCGVTPLIPVPELHIAGRHNVANALAALALGAAVGVDPLTMVAGLRTFAGLPHRMQVVSAAGGVTWIDDSKATNVGAAVASIAGVRDPLVLIAGGDGKGADFDGLADVLRGRDCVAILLGRDRELISAALSGVCPTHRVAGMRDAVRLAASLARPGGSVLLAPACSSLDMYTDFGARGDDFAAAVRETNP
jgi:UDP-N-acetylmuramoylalanine--D-glutamate ligase